MSIKNNIDISIKIKTRSKMCWLKETSKKIYIDKKGLPLSIGKSNVSFGKSSTC